MKRIILVAALCSCLGSCIEPAEVEEIGPDRYAVNVQALNIEGGDARAFDKALLTASDYCTQLGLKLNMESLRSSAMSVTADAKAVFQCVPG